MNVTTEILQYQDTSIINDQDKDDVTGLDVSCNLGSLDIHEATKVNDFEKLVNTAMRLLTSVSEMTNIVNVPSVAKANKLMHSVGLGAMNLHGHLATQNIHYGSKDSVTFIDKFMEAVNYYSLKTSMLIAKEKGETFYQYEKSDYATGVYFDKYVTKLDEDVNEVVKKALGTTPIITSEMWKQLKEDVMKYGIFHSYRLATAPTGSISYIRNCTASLQPVTERVEVRDYGDSRTIYPMPFLTNDNQHLFTEAYETNMYKMIDVYSAAQQHIDQGISMTLYVTNQWTTEQLAKVYVYAWLKNIKSVYYVRQKLQTLEECLACSI